MGIPDSSRPFYTFQNMRWAVEKWAAENIDGYNTKTVEPCRIYGDALSEGVITEEEYKQAKASFGVLWTMRKEKW